MSVSASENLSVCVFVLSNTTTALSVFFHLFPRGIIAVMITIVISDKILDCILIIDSDREEMLLVSVFAGVVHCTEALFEQNVF